MRSCRLALGVVLLALAAGCSTTRGALLYGSGSEALERGEVARAVTDLEQAARLVPHASEVHNHLGIAYLADGRETDALHAFRRAVDLDCGNRAAQRNLRTLELRMAAAAGSAQAAPAVVSPVGDAARRVEADRAVP